MLFGGENPPMLFGGDKLPMLFGYLFLENGSGSETLFKSCQFNKLTESSSTLSNGW